ncbi:MAG: ROK family protein [Bacteroidia bacterium]|nr:ROK family protein [Bacteroidia bacterium]
MKPIWGIDLGGTKIEAVVVDADNRYQTIARLRVPTEQEKGYEHIVSQIAKLIGMLKDETGLTPTKIGIGTPGALDPQLNTLKNSNTTCLIGKPLKDDVEKALGLSILMANDANCFALAEARLGIVPDQVPNAEVVFGVIMGTGVGGGIVVHGKVLNGLQGIAGEWGHNFLDESGGLCYCGKTGCVETILSGPNLQRYYTSISGEERKLKEIVERAQAGTDPHAAATLDRLVEFFGKGLASIINLLDPDAIVLGGGVSNIGVLYDRGVAEVEKYVFNHKMYTPILRPKLGDSAGVFGAAMLVE